MSKMTYRKIEEKPSVTINKKKKDLQFIGISPTGEAVFCTNILSVEDLISLGAQSYNYNDAYFPFNVVLKNDLDLVTSVVLDAIERGDFAPSEEQQLALDRLVDATDGVCYPVLMDRVNRTYPEMIKKFNAEKMCKDIEKAVEGVEDDPDDSNKNDGKYKTIIPRYTSPTYPNAIGVKKDKSEPIKSDKDLELEVKNMTKVADFMETHNTFDENGHIDYYKLANAIDKFGPIKFD